MSESTGLRSPPFQNHKAGAILMLEKFRNENGKYIPHACPLEQYTNLSELWIFFHYTSKEHDDVRTLGVHNNIPSEILTFLNVIDPGNARTGLTNSQYDFCCLWDDMLSLQDKLQILLSIFSLPSYSSYMANADLLLKLLPWR